MHFSLYTTKKIEKIFQDLKTSTSGLENEEVILRQKQYGLNEIFGKEVAGWQIFLRQIKSPFIYLLFFASFLALLLGEKIDAAMILLFVIIAAGLGFYQEYHSECALKLLKKHIERYAKVCRDGREELISSRNLVPGDIVVVETGDIIPADLRFFEENDLMVDEEILTGESVPIRKITSELKDEAKEIYQAENIGFSGTSVVSGKGMGVILATGNKTVIGEIGKLTAKTERESIFERGVLKFSRFIMRMILVTLTFVFLANLFIKGKEADVIELIIFSIALAVSIIPEALPLVTTISLSKGALHLAKKKVVVKRLSAIEDLGSVEVLCSDKTGTLTENKLTVAKIYAQREKDCLFQAVLASSFLAEREEPNNAFDLALCKSLSGEEKAKLKNYQRICELPFDPERRCNSVLVKSKLNEEKSYLIVRGAPENIFQLCANLSCEEKRKLERWTEEEGKKGHRLIAMAKKEMLEVKEYGEEAEKDLEFLGIISFFDPIKKTTLQTVKKAEDLGVKIKILTGDSREVAGVVAYQIGLVKSPEAVILGEEFEKASLQKQEEIVKKYSVFARISPLQKYKIIQLLEKNCEVGFLGEGINDAPALKAANVALVVESGAEIAKESADIVLLKKNLDVIVEGISEGRKVFANIVKYIKITLVSNFGNFYAIAIASLLLTFLPMLPLQILLLNLLSDFPMIAIATDSVDAKELQRPRGYNIKDIVLISVILGIVSTIFDFIFFALFYRISPSVLQTNWFIGSILTELVLIFSLRTNLFFFKAKRPSLALSGLSVLAIFFTLFLPFLRFGQEFFKFVQPQVFHLWLIFGVVLCYFVLTEIVKLRLLKNSTLH